MTVSLWCRPGEGAGADDLHQGRWLASTCKSLLHSQHSTGYGCLLSHRELAAQIDVLEVDGKYYGFSGCHRFEVGPPCCTLAGHLTAVQVKQSGLHAPCVAGSSFTETTRVCCTGATKTWERDHHVQSAESKPDDSENAHDVRLCDAVPLPPALCPAFAQGAPTHGNQGSMPCRVHAWT